MGLKTAHGLEGKYVIGRQTISRIMKWTKYHGWSEKCFEVIKLPFLASRAEILCRLTINYFCWEGGGRGCIRNRIKFDPKNIIWGCHHGVLNPDWKVEGRGWMPIKKSLTGSGFRWQTLWIRKTKFEESDPYILVFDNPGRNRIIIILMYIFHTMQSYTIHHKEIAIHRTAPLPRTLSLSSIFLTGPIEIEG